MVTTWLVNFMKPADRKPRQNNRNRGYQASMEEKRGNTSNPNIFNTEQLEQLYKLFSNFQNPGQSSNVPTGSLAHRGNFLIALNSEKIKTPWIIDSSASDHMTDCHFLFSSYTPCASN